MTTSSSLPNEILESIAIANAKCVGEQPAILANLALSNLIFNNNLQQQASVAQQQALFQVLLAAVSKVVSVILTDGIDETEKKAGAQSSLEVVDELLKKCDTIHKTFQETSQANIEMVAKLAEQLKESQRKNNDV